MKKKELDQVVVLDAIVKREITQEEGAQLLRLSSRQVRRKLRRYINKGIAGLAHKGRGRPSNRKITQALEEEIIKFARDKYFDFGPTFLKEKLNECESIKIGTETVRRLLIKNGLWEEKKRTLKKHVWRERKHHFGELVQVDGSYHIWFGNQYYTLISFIDDATGALLEARLVDQERYLTVMGCMISYLKKWGRPRALYTDKGKVYKVNNAPEGQKRITQFERMLNELDIELVHAHSPQAKGRVERHFKTMQDRFVKELRLRKIEDLDRANIYLRNEFVDIYNEKFALQPKDQLDLHRSIESFDLNSIFCIKEKRTLNNDRTISYKNKWLQLKKKQPIPLYKKTKVTVRVHMDGTISLSVKGKKLDYRENDKKPPKIQRKIDRKVSQKLYKPIKDHPWRKWCK